MPPRPDLLMGGESDAGMIITTMASFLKLSFPFFLIVRDRKEK